MVSGYTAGNKLSPLVMKLGGVFGVTHSRTSHLTAIGCHIWLVSRPTRHARALSTTSCDKSS